MNPLTFGGHRERLHPYWQYPLIGDGLSSVNASSSKMRHTHILSHTHSLRQVSLTGRLRHRSILTGVDFTAELPEPLALSVTDRQRLTRKVAPPPDSLEDALAEQRMSHLFPVIDALGIEDLPDLEHALSRNAQGPLAHLRLQDRSALQTVIANARLCGQRLFRTDKEMRRCADKVPQYSQLTPDELVDPRHFGLPTTCI